MFDRRLALCCTLWWASGCSKAAPGECVPGTIKVGASCLTACSQPSDCLSSEICDPSLAACVPRSGAADAGLTDGETFDAQPEPSDGGGTHSLELEPAVVDFGTTFAGCAAIERNAVLRNTGSQTVRIRQFAIVGTDAMQFRLLPTPVSPTLRPSETIDLVVQYAGDQLGAHQATLRVDTLAGLTVTSDLIGKSEDAAQKLQPPVVMDQIDMVLVVDDSPSAGPVQLSFANQIPALLAGLRSHGYDFHIGVTTTDLSAGGSGGIFVGMPRVLTPQTPNVDTLLIERVRPGLNGSAIGRGLEAARIAITEPRLSNEHAGFLRADAALVVIVASSQDDQSLAEIAVYVDAIETAKTDPVTAALNAVVPTNVQCGQLNLPRRYEQVARATGGVVDNLCQIVWSNALGVFPRSSVIVPSSYTLSYPPEPSSLAVTIDAQPLSPTAWSYDPASLALTLATPPSYGAQVEITYRAACN